MRIPGSRKRFYACSKLGQFTSQFGTCVKTLMPVRAQTPFPFSHNFDFPKSGTLSNLKLTQRVPDLANRNRGRIGRSLMRAMANSNNDWMISRILAMMNLYPSVVHFQEISFPDNSLFCVFEPYIHPLHFHTLSRVCQWVSRGYK
jgi:hypothetical protein